jgi:hypothetical protein
MRAGHKNRCIILLWNVYRIQQLRFAFYLFRDNYREHKKSSKTSTPKKIPIAFKPMLPATKPRSGPITIVFWEVYPQNAPFD